ncbi:MerR family transcriptional regulator [Streptomyces sp. G-G2]|uniref:MerR family transcriptional regulator n=1 Tax=Streptomyces sp. G-G2 TaxID=3046201 RepID=UPI0024B8F64D|nr:MerR family transcriptional regulator [Streptomyces sp. G-G2]MDJ0383019.1 MerR family transcriptional regulator [Streptomyces sp. G-G2]
MRIGEIAALVGVTTRAIRHYHHVGLPPEPERRPNGYRAYSVRDAVLLARVRRLTELGLSLDEVRDVLALYERLDALAGAPADDPRIPDLAAELVAAVPAEVFAAMPAASEGPSAQGLKEALLADYPPAQAEVVRRLMAAFTDRPCGEGNRP